MRAVALSVMVLVAGLMGTPARADTYVGLAIDSGLIGVNVEKAGKFGSAYLMLGTFQSPTGLEPANLTGIIGYRRYQGGRFAENGYFGGVFLGDIAGGTDYNRYGLGGELGYQWLTEHLRMTLSAGMGLVGDGSGPRAPTPGTLEPAPLLGASINLRF